MKMLEKLGCDVHVAADGVEALAAVKAHGFDVIFMDCNMPEMDGYEATAAIRAFEAATLGGAWRTPIIALTANALVGDRERSLAADMDEHVSKPLVPNVLQAVLAAWVGPPAAIQG